MGQYFRPVLQTRDETLVFNRDVEGEYMLAKLMEHSWWKNPMVAAVCKQIADRGKVKLAWVGDYADDHIPGINITSKDVWNQEGEDLPAEYVYLNKKFLVNHSKNVYLDCEKYFKRSIHHSKSRNKGAAIHPLPLLTAWGNDRGGGDFHRGNYEMPNIGYEHVGSWCGDLISIENSPPEGYAEFNVVFIER